MILQSKNLFSYLFLLIPLFLITGPAIPDIVITFGGLFGIFYILYQKEYDNFIKLNLFRISIIADPKISNPLLVFNLPEKTIIFSFFCNFFIGLIKL